jgi:putative tryptophan/tyrosine transport system substrate-binding protein
MRRREFITLLGGATVVWPLAAGAQEPGRTYRLGGLNNNPRTAPHFIALFDELRRAGFVESHNLVVAGRGWAVRNEQFAEIAAELVEAKVDVIVCAGDVAIHAAQQATTIAIHAAQQATTTIPIMAITDDMVGSGLVRSLAHPGGNTTGVSILATELDGKRQEILMEAAPDIRRMAALADSNTTAPRQLQALQDAARVRGVELSIQQVGRAEDIVPAIDAVQASGAAALNVLATPLLHANRRIIIERTAALRLPAIYQWPEMAEDGGLLAYGPRIVQIYRQIFARQLVKLLRGAKPADLPVEQPTKFELVINLKTAKALGLTVPDKLIALADEVID